MEWEAVFIHGLQTMSNGFTDMLFGILTLLGDEVFVIAVIMLFYWCISKKLGFKFLNIYGVVSGVNAGIKSIAKRVRPFDKYPDIVGSIGEKSGGYSFPSGHTSSITCVSTLTCIEYRKHLKIFLPVGIALTVIVMFSRMYLGQHYPTDVLAAAVISAAVSTGLYFLYDLIGKRDKEEWIGIVGLPAAIIVAVLVGTLASGETVRKVLEVCGVLASVYIGYFVEKRYVKFDTETVIWKQFVKYVLGAAVAFGLYIGLKYAFSFDAVGWLYGFTRFFLLGVWLTLGAPLIFRLLKLEGKSKKAA